MKNQFAVLCAVSLMLILSVGCRPKKPSKQPVVSDQITNFYSTAGAESEVQFQAIYKTNEYTLEDIKKLDSSSKKYIEQAGIKPTIKFLFGPLTHRSIGGMKTSMKLNVLWEKAAQEEGHVAIPYHYSGTWILSAQLLTNAQPISLPLPFNASELQTKNWLACTDSDPEHQTQSFFWYFWDPSRYGCDHQLNSQYQEIELAFLNKTVATIETFPDYKKLTESANIKNNLQMTFAFGYVEDAVDARPDSDSDYGMEQYRKFIKYMDLQTIELQLKKTPIYQNEYLNPRHPQKQIGYRYSGLKDEVKIEIKVVTSANIDQMDLFAKSYAHDHDGYFSWFGHSRVGSGFDAENFASMLRYNPQYYSLTPQYQLVYWAGCNSYSYYAQPFFDQKAQLNLATDPLGTKNLDILANGLPSLFSFNADNAIILYNALIQWQKPTSYQSIVKQLERRAARSNYLVLVNILGDEDNAL